MGDWTSQRVGRVGRTWIHHPCASVNPTAGGLRGVIRDREPPCPGTSVRSPCTAMRPRGDGAFDPDRLDGRDADLVEAVLPVVQWFNQRYLRLRVEGLEHLAQGPALYVGNHNGGIAGPDLACTLGTLWSARGPRAPLYALAHDFAMRQVPVLGRVLQRFGAVRAHPDNAVRALATGAPCLVYPGGDLEAYRHARRRDEVILGRRTGFLRVARDAGVPVVPVVAHGAHRSAYIFTEGEGIARALGLKRWGRLERFPLALSLPWGVAVGPWVPYLPLPFPVRLRILPPMTVSPGDNLDATLASVQTVMQSALDDLARDNPVRDVPVRDVSQGPR